MALELQNRALNLAHRVEGLRPYVDGFRAIKVPAWEGRNKRDEEQLTVVLATSLRRDSNAIDVGAASGEILRKILRIAPEGHHVAFEPRPDAASRLLSHFPTVEVHQAAAGETSGTHEFTVVPGLPELSGFDPRPWPHANLARHSITVEVVRLDDVVTHSVDLLKIDVEGAELACLLGAQRILVESGPIIVFEHGATIPSDPEKAEHGDLWRLLSSSGYRIFDIDGEGPLSSHEFASASASGRMWNFIARP